jgi:endonuclease-3
VPQSRITVPVLLDRLQRFYGPQEPCFPVDPYEFLVWWYCGYPASDASCTKGWNRLAGEVGIDPDELLSARPPKLTAALKAGGMFPELRAERLKEIALRVQNEFRGDLRACLVGPLAQARRTLKSFHGIADPGADRILLFAGIAAIAAVPSNCPYVIVRILGGKQSENYAATYREAQRLIAAELPQKPDALTRAYLLLKHHGQELCKRSKPKCEACPLKPNCAYFGDLRTRR